MILIAADEEGTNHILRSLKNVPGGRFKIESWCGIRFMTDLVEQVGTSSSGLCVPCHLARLHAEEPSKPKAIKSQEETT